MSRADRIMSETKGCIYHIDVDKDDLEQIKMFKDFSERIVLTDEKTGKVFYDFRGRAGLLNEFAMEIYIKTAREDNAKALESVEYDLYIGYDTIKAVVNRDISEFENIMKDYSEDWLRNMSRKIKYTNIIT